MKIVVTGGHFSPAYALLKELGADNILVVGRKYAFEGDTNLTYEYQVCKKLGIKFEVLNAGRLQRKFSSKTIPSLAKFPRGIFEATKILKEFRPDVIITFGGYVGLPVALAGRLLNIPVVLHEQTLGAGLSSKVISRFAAVILLSFETSYKYFKGKNTVLTGNPLRPELVEKLKKLTEKKRVIYITGGSTGSHAINIAVANILDSLLPEFEVYHQVGAGNEFQDFQRMTEFKKSLDQKLQEKYYVQEFFDSLEVADLMSKSELVISRAGINTITELIALKTPALLIPLPHGQHNEQLHNALFFEKEGLGRVIEQESLTTDNLLIAIHAMIKEKNVYTKNFERAQKYIHLDASKKIKEQVYLYGRQTGTRSESTQE